MQVWAGCVGNYRNYKQNKCGTFFRDTQYYIYKFNWSTVGKQNLLTQNKRTSNIQLLCFVNNLTWERLLKLMTLCSKDQFIKIIYIKSTQGAFSSFFFSSSHIKISLTRHRLEGGSDPTPPPLGFSRISSSFITVSTWNLAHLSGHQFSVVSCKENQNRPEIFAIGRILWRHFTRFWADKR